MSVGCQHLPKQSWFTRLVFAYPGAVTVLAALLFWIAVGVIAAFVF